MDEVRISPAGDPFYVAGKRTEAELVKAIAEDDAKPSQNAPSGLCVNCH